MYVKQMPDATNQVTSVVHLFFCLQIQTFNIVNVRHFEVFDFASGVFPVLDCGIEVCLFSF